MADGGPEWELSKENVQPLKNGREMDSLSAALQHGASDMARLQSQRQDYEVQLRMYNGDDPMSVWDEYIKWTEQNFPTAGKESHLVTLLERCVLHFNDCEELKNDFRFIDVWVKVANMSTEPGDIFTYMYNHGLGCKLASFYVAWAGVLESLGDTKKADAVFDMGMTSAAEPRDLLLRRHSEFQVRITRLTMTGQLEREETASSQKPRRALGTLKAPGKKGAVPSIRATTSSAVKLSVSASSGNRSGPGFAVCQDENATSSSLLPPQTGEYASVPVQSETNRENTQAAGVWTNARARQKVRTPLSAEPGFTVYAEGDGSEQVMATPMKGNPRFEQQVLSERKVKQTNFLQNFEQARGESKTEGIPMYCKELIYGGVKELSFEELRAAMYEVKKKEEKKEQEQKQVYASMKDKLKEELRQEIEAQMTEKFKKQLEEERQALISSLSKVNIQEKNSSAATSQMEASMFNSNKRPLGEVSEDIPNKIHSSSSAASSFLSDPPSTNVHSLSARSDPPSANYSNNLGRPGSSLADRNASISGRHDIHANHSSSTGPIQIHGDHSATCQTPDLPSVNASGSISKLDPPSACSSGSLAGRSNPSAADHSSLNLSRQVPPSTDKSLSSSSHTQNRSRCNLFGQKLNLSRSTGLSNSSCRTPDPSTSFNLSTKSDQRTSSSNQMTPNGHSGLFSMTGSNGHLPSADPTPDSSMTGRFGFGSKGSLTAPSPTVNTKAAMQVVQSMFNRTLNTNDVAGDFGWDNNHNANDDSEDDDCLSQFANKTGLGTGPPGIGKGFSLAGFQIFDENAENDAKPQATDAADKENVGRSGAKPACPLLPKARLPLQPKKVAPVVDAENAPLEEMEHQMSVKPMRPQSQVVPYEDEKAMEPENVITADQYSLSPKTYTMPMPNPADDEDDVHVAWDMGDLTFAPNCMSTRIFHPQSMQMASTPFTPSMDVGSLPAPPVDTLSNESIVPPKTPKTFTETPSTEQTPGTTVNSTAPSFNETNATRNDRTEKGLSPIIETSNEDTRSTTSSSNGYSTLDHHSSLSATHGPHHTTANGQGLRPMSPIKEPSHESLFERTCHEIDITSYVPSSPRRDDLDKSVMINPLDPFDEEEIAKFLALLDEPLEYSKNYQESKDPMPAFKQDGFYLLGDDQIRVLESVGKGAFGQVFKVSLRKDDFDDDDDDVQETKVIKTQKPPCPWELYITNELHQRLAEVKGIPDVRPSIMTIQRGYFFTDGSCLLYDFYKYGTLLNIANMYKRNRLKMPEVYIMYITCELLTITEAMMECNIIHGDIKPDNFLFRGLPDLKDVPDSEVFSGPTKALMMIDFGRSIDLNFYPKGTTFTNRVNTSCFMCPEMMTERPWTYQTDLFGLAGTVFLLMFLDYMKVYQEKGIWRTTGTFRRQWQFGDLWLKFFHIMINVDNCNDLPNLRELREEFQRVFLTQKMAYIRNHPQLELQLYKM